MVLFTDNGKLIERLGRKAIGPSERSGSQLTEEESFFISIDEQHLQNKLS